MLNGPQLGAPQHGMPSRQGNTRAADHEDTTAFRIGVGEIVVHHLPPGGSSSVTGAVVLHQTGVLKDGAELAAAVVEFDGGELQAHQVIILRPFALLQLGDPAGQHGAFRRKDLAALLDVAPDQRRDRIARGGAA